MKASLPASIPAALVSGLLIGCSFPPSHVPYLAWFALIPLLWIWANETSPARLAAATFFAFTSAFVIAFGWVARHAFPSTGWISLGVLLTMPIFYVVPFGISSFVRNRFGLKTGLVALVILILCSEFFLIHGPIPMPWILIGQTQASDLRLSQLVNLAGSLGLTLWLVSINILLYLCATHRRMPVRWLTGCTALLSIGAAYVYGFFSVGNTETSGSITIGYVQPAIEATAWAEPDGSSRVERLVSLSDSLIRAEHRDIDWLIWPETALPPVHGTSNDTNYTDIQQWVNRNDVTLITGAITAVIDDPSTFRNSALVFQSGKPVSMYHKTILVPFAEQVPGIEQAPWLEFLTVESGGVNRYVTGRGPQMMAIGDMGAGVLICFESLFGDYARTYKWDGADVLIVITQDGWWGQSRAPSQHLILNRLRAIETGISVVQASVSGRSAFILPDGTIHQQLQWMEPGARVMRVPLSAKNTLYSKAGDWPGWISLPGAAFFLLIVLFPRRSYSENKPLEKKKTG